MELPLLIENILVFFTLLALVLLVLYLFSRPFKWFFKWLLNAVAGVSVLFLLSFLGPIFGLEVSLNAVTVAVSLLLGLPGVALILVKMFFL